MTREDLKNLEANLKKLKDLTEITAESAHTIKFYYDTERIEPSWELDERVAKAIINAEKVMQEIKKIEREFIPPWE